MFRARLLLSLVLLALAVSAHAATVAGTVPADGARQWREDLAFLAAELPKRHKNLFFKLTEDEWKQKVKALDDAIPGLTEAGIVAGLLELTASVGDQHTGINALGSSALTPLPLVLYWFADGIFVVAAAEEYKDALGCRVEKVGSTGAEQACEKLSKLYAWENDSSKRLKAPQFLVVPQFLQALKTAPDSDRIVLTLRDGKGRRRTMDLRPVKPSPDMKMVTVLDEPKGAQPISRRNPELPYWAEYVEKGNMVYFQYSRCIDSQEKPFAGMRSALDKLLAEHADARLVIDLRRNSGGNSMVLDPFISALKGNRDLNRKGRIFVIVGRRTFSSAILNAARLRNETEAIFVGETTGSSPNHYGEVKTMELPNSKLQVTYSISYFKYSDTDGPIVPDLPADLSFRDYAKGTDPALDAVVGYRPAESR